MFVWGFNADFKIYFLVIYILAVRPPEPDARITNQNYYNQSIRNSRIIPESNDHLTRCPRSNGHRPKSTPAFQIRTKLNNFIFYFACFMDTELFPRDRV